MSTLSIILVTVLALAPAPFITLLRAGSSTGPFPAVKTALICAWMAWIALVVILAFNSPTLLYALALVTTLVMALAWWRGRASYGRARGLPPGSLALSQSLMAIVDRDYYLRAAERFGPVFKMSQFHQPTVCVIGLERGHRLFREHRHSFGPVSQPFNRSVEGGFLRYMDTDTHAIYARLFNKALSLPVLTQAVPDVESASRAVLSAMAKSCQASDPPETSPRLFCEQLSYDTFVRVLFGLNSGTPEYDEMKAHYSGLDSYNIGSRVDSGTEQSLQKLRMFLQARANGMIASEDSSVTCTLTELHRLDAAMPDRVCVDNLLFILKISSANVASLLLWLFKMLGENPGWMDRIAAAGQGIGEYGQVDVMDSVVKETLRLAQSEYLYRKLLDDVELDGMTLPKGWLVRLCVRESHVSPSDFEHPLDFEPERFLRKKTAVSEYAPFGYGAHGCNGIALTDVICRAFLKTLASDFEWRIVRDGPLERGFRHWSHWQPSSDLRIRMLAGGEPAR